MVKRLNFQKIPLSQVGSAMTTPDSTTLPVVLVVDDEHLVADTLVAILNKQNYSATAAYSAEEALLVADVIPPDYLITDIMMPGMDGIDLASAIKELVPDCKILLFSGHAQVANIYNDPRCLQHEFPLLTKPVHPDALLAYIANLTPSVMSQRTADMQIA